MGLDAQVIAVGPFSQAVVPAMEYPAEYYTGVIAGATVVTNVFGACTSEISHKLAHEFGVGAMELGNHVLYPDKANHTLLLELFGEEDVDRFLLLARCGFAFYYLPNA
jgi:hypothetical protein